MEEKWQSKFNGRIVVKQRTVDGVTPQMILPGREFMISSADRRLHQSAVADKRYDPFTNGSFVPLSLPEEVAVELGVQPNHVSDAEIRAVALGSEADALAVLRKLDAPAVLGRVLSAAQQLGASGPRLDLIEAQLDSVDPSKQSTFGRASRPAEVFQASAGRLAGEIDASPVAPTTEVNSLGEPVVAW